MKITTSIKCGTMIDQKFSWSIPEEQLSNEWLAGRIADAALGCISCDNLNLNSDDGSRFENAIDQRQYAAKRRVEIASANPALLELILHTLRGNLEIITD